MFYVGLNDFYTSKSNGEWDQVIIPKSEDDFDLLTIAKLKSALYNTYINMVGYKNMNANLGHRRINFSKIEWTGVDITKLTEPDYNTWAEHIKSYRNRLVEIFEKTRAMRAEPIFVNQFSFFTHVRMGKLYYYSPTLLDEATEHYFGFKKFAEATIEARIRINAICVDLNNELGPKFDKSHFYDASHNTPQGSKIIGKYLGQKLFPLFGKSGN